MDAAAALAECRHVLQAGPVQLKQILLALYFSQPHRNADAITRMEFDQLQGRLRQTYQERHGRILGLFHNTHTRAGVILARGRLADTPAEATRLMAFGPRSEVSIEDDCILELAAIDDLGSYHPIMKLISEAWMLAGDLRLLHDPRPKLRIKREIYAYFTRLLSLVDSLEDKRKTGGAVAEGDYVPIPMYREELARIQKEFTEVLAHQSKIDYLAGMAQTSLLLLPACIVIAAALQFAVGWHLAASFAGALFIGSLGAVLSVAIRLQERLSTVGTKADALLTRLYGQARPLVGAILGLAVFLAINGNLAPLSVPTEPATRFFFLMTFCFLGGFGERWVQGLAGLPGQP